MREMAAERGQSLIDFSKYAERHPNVDKEIDRRQKKLAKGDCVVDGRLSAHFLKADVRVWLMAPIKVRAKRICARDKFASLKEAAEHIRRREQSERRRYRKIYGIDYTDTGIYDLIVNTSAFGIGAMTAIVAAAVENMRK